MIGRMLKVQSVLSSREAEGFVDTAIKILMAVVIGALILAGSVRPVRKNDPADAQTAY